MYQEQATTGGNPNECGTVWLDETLTARPNWNRAEQGIGRGIPSGDVLLMMSINEDREDQG